MNQDTQHDESKTAMSTSREHIDVDKPYELRYWAQRLGVTPETLRAAVVDVGSDSGNVARHLRERD